MSVVRELVTLLGFEVDENGLGKAESGIENLKKATLRLTGLFVGIGAGLYKLVQTTADFGDHLAKTSQRIGVGVEDLQRFQYAATLSDVGTEEFSQSLSLLARKVFDAGRGLKESQESFKRLGISLKDTQGNVKTTDKLFLEISDKIAAMPAGLLKTATAMDLFGRSGAKMIPLLNSGSQAIIEAGKELDEFGIVMGVDAAEASEKFNDSLTTIKFILEGFKNVVGARLLPLFLQATRAFIDWLKVNREIIKVKVYDFVISLVRVFKQFLLVGKDIYTFLGGLIERLGGIEKAFRLLEIAVGFFVAYNLANTFIGIASAAGKLATALLGVAGAATLADIAIAAIPLLIAAIAVAAYLIYDDIKAFLEGRPSAFGAFYEKALPVVQKLKQLWSTFTATLSDYWLVFKTDMLPIIEDFVSRLWGMSEPLRTFLSYLYEITPLLKIMGELFKASPFAILFKTLDWSNQAVRKRADEIRADQNRGRGIEPVDKAELDRVWEEQTNPFGGTVGPPGFNDLLNPAPPAGISTSGGGSTQNNQLSVDQKIEVNVETGADPDKIAETVRKVTKGDLGDLLFSTAKVLEAGHD